MVSFFRCSIAGHDNDKFTSSDFSFLYLVMVLEDWLLANEVLLNLQEFFGSSRFGYGVGRLVWDSQDFFFFFKKSKKINLYVV